MERFKLAEESQKRGENTMSRIKSILITRDNMSPSEADDLISQAQDQLNEYLAAGQEDLAYDICAEFFGLEPDYIDELL